MRSGKYKFLQLVIDGKVEGRRGIGRKKVLAADDWTGLHDIHSLIHAARERSIGKRDR